MSAPDLDITYARCIRRVMTRGRMGLGENGGSSMVATLRAYLPRGNTLDAETFRRRHLLLCTILGLHIPALFAFGVWRGFSVGSVALEMLTPTLALVCARVA